MGSTLGVLKVAARRVGVSLGEYQQRVADGQKWCGGCRDWHPLAAFHIDASRGDGLAARCRTVQNRRPRTERDPVKERARHLVNRDVRRGRLPRANDVPCTDCGAVWKPDVDRHEYDHFRGYEGAAALQAEVVCAACHRRRERGRQIEN